LNKNSLENKIFCVDIIITDVPYGSLVKWSEKTNDSINILLNTLISIINKNTIIAIIHKKNQKVNNSQYIRIKKLRVGHRIIEILKLKFMERGGTSHNRSVNAPALRASGVRSARSVATLLPTPPSATFGRHETLRVSL
jgi:hypothetical protein